MKNNNFKDVQKLDNLIIKEEFKKSNNISKITEKIYLGDIEGATDYIYFKNEQIHNVLSIVNEPPIYPPEMKIRQKNLRIEDNSRNNIIQYFPECIDFIENSDKIYIHCLFGISRSSTIVIAYLMWKTHSNFQEVYNFVKKRRNIIEPNKGFITQLKQFEELLISNNYDLLKIDFKSLKK